MPALAQVPTFSQVFESEVGYVWRLLRCMGVPERDLDDVAQEVFVVVHRRLPSFDPQRGQIRTWLYAIALNLVRNHRRRAHVRHEMVVAETPELVASDSPEASLEAQQARDLLQRALETLEPAQREVFVLHDVVELSMREVAAQQEVPVATAYSRLRLARQKLRRWLVMAAKREVR